MPSSGISASLIQQALDTQGAGDLIESLRQQGILPAKFAIVAFNPRAAKEKRITYREYGDADLSHLRAAEDCAARRATGHAGSDFVLGTSLSGASDEEVVAAITKVIADYVASPASKQLKFFTAPRALPRQMAAE